jgi:tryptophan 2,3-dioxygenase
MPALYVREKRYLDARDVARRSCDVIAGITTLWGDSDNARDLRALSEQSEGFARVTLRAMANRLGAAAQVLRDYNPDLADHADTLAELALFVCDCQSHDDATVLDLHTGADDFGDDIAARAWYVRQSMPADTRLLYRP